MLRQEHSVASNVSYHFDVFKGRRNYNLCLQVQREAQRGQGLSQSL